MPPTLVSRSGRPGNCEIKDNRPKTSSQGNPTNGTELFQNKPKTFSGPLLKTSKHFQDPPPRETPKEPPRRGPKSSPNPLTRAKGPPRVPQGLPQGSSQGSIQGSTQGSAEAPPRVPTYLLTYLLFACRRDIRAYSTLSSRDQHHTQHTIAQQRKVHIVGAVICYGIIR